VNALVFGSEEARQIFLADRELMRRIDAAPGKVEEANKEIQEIAAALEFVNIEIDDLELDLLTAERGGSPADEVEDYEEELRLLRRQRESLARQKDLATSRLNQMKELIQ